MKKAKRTKYASINTGNDYKNYVEIKLISNGRNY